MALQLPMATWYHNAQREKLEGMKAYANAYNRDY
jgi:hypothetical protein